jgi:hypothetical protein
LGLPGFIRIGGRTIAATEEIISGASHNQNRDDDGRNADPTLVPVVIVVKEFAILRGAHRRLVIHTGIPKINFRERILPYDVQIMAVLP